MKKSKGYVILSIALVFMVLLGWYTFDITGKTSKKSDDGIKLGLDLSGGVSITYQIEDDNPSQTDINDTIAKLEERAESYSTEYAVYQVGTDRIAVEIPGVSDANAVLEGLGSPGSLYFIKQKDSEGNLNYQYDAQVGNSVLTTDIETLIENGSVIFDGNGVKNAEATYQQNQTYGTNEPVVSLVFNDEATDIFAEATKEAKESGDSIGIYYDGHFISVATVSQVIGDGKCVITGIDTFEECQEIATFIRVGAINLKLTELESNVVGAQLGSAAISTSIKAAIIGLILVMIFMVVMYGVPGVAADVALAIYITMTVAFIHMFEVTLTLPGIAGVILGIGMAVDANVITFARIREEIAAGNTVWASINNGYHKALSAILDGNITTFIVALILMLLGSGTVKGFAYTLMISIVISMFTALVVAKFVLRALFAVGLKNEKFYGRAKDNKTIDFMKHRFVYMAISLVVILAGIVSMGIHGATSGKALNYSLEFVGGTSTTFDFGQNYSPDENEAEVMAWVEKITGDSAVQINAVDNSTDITIKTRTLSQEERQAMADKIVEVYGVAEDSITTQSISATISNEMRSSAIVAVIVAVLFILIYIRFRFKDFKFATSAVVALAHDVLIVLATYALIRISVGNTFIACMLTIVGYSVNDTIVIFDRIRENLHGREIKSAEELAEIANRSLTQTLSRSINTSITTFITVVVLYILGIASIREFALPLMVGLISGAYSSIFIATELWYMMKVRALKKAAK